MRISQQKRRKANRICYVIAGCILAVELLCVLDTYMLANEYHLADELLLTMCACGLAIFLCIVMCVKRKIAMLGGSIFSLVLAFLNFVSRYTIECDECYSQSEQMFSRIVEVASKANIVLCAVICIMSLVLVVAKTDDKECKEKGML